MTYGPVTRPEASEEKIRTSDSFELCYLRHQYFRRAKYNPTEEEMQPYMYIVANLTKNTFFTYFNLFKAVGMYQEDVFSIGQVHLVSFLGLYALEKSQVKREEFADKFLRFNYKEAENKDFLQKNRANFTMFFKQRMEDLVRVCRQKVRNIKGQPSEEYAVFSSKDEPPKYVYKLLKSYAELGYKKVDFSIFKSIRKKADVNADATIFKFDDLWYVAIALEQKNLELDDLVGSEYNPYQNSHNMSPDILFEQKESENEIERLSHLFNLKSDYRKKVTLSNFIAKNRKKSQYREEVAAARKLLRSLGD